MKVLFLIIFSIIFQTLFPIFFLLFPLIFYFFVYKEKLKTAVLLTFWGGLATDFILIQQFGITSLGIFGGLAVLFLCNRFLELKKKILRLISFVLFLTTSILIILWLNHQLSFVSFYQIFIYNFILGGLLILLKSYL